MRYEKYFWLTRLLSSFLVGAQLWLFMWAPVNGYGLAVSLGYFIMPITMVIIGRLAFQERLTPHQKVACLFALIAIINLLIVSQSFLWPVWVVCIGYPIYFWLYKKNNTNNISCFLYRNEIYQKLLKAITLINQKAQDELALLLCYLKLKAVKLRRFTNQARP